MFYERNGVFGFLPLVFEHRTRFLLADCYVYFIGLACVAKPLGASKPELIFHVYSSNHALGRLGSVDVSIPVAHCRPDVLYT